MDRGAIRPPTIDVRAAWSALGAAMAASVALVLWLGRETTFSIDELATFMDSPDLDTDGVLEPHNGHVAITARLVYKTVFETVGADYIAFRILAAGAVVLLAGLMFAYMSRRVGKLVALAPALVLLFFGTDFPHLLQGNGLAVLLSLSAGVGALLALDRRDARGDTGACALLCLGVVTYTVSLAFVVGAAASVWLRGERRRLWVALVPAFLYAAWWLWARGEPGDAEEQIDLSNLLLIPAWAFQSLAAILGGLVGLDYDFTDAEGLDGIAGPVLALLAVIALAWRLRHPHRVPATLWAALAVLVTLWVMGGLVANDVRTPDSTRYMYPGAVAVLLVAAEATATTRWSRTAVVAVFAVAAIGVATNIALLRDGASDLRDGHTVDARSALAGVELAGAAADPSFNPNEAADEASPLRQSVVAAPFAAAAADGESPAGEYLEAADRYGTIGYSAAEVRGLDETARIRTDAFLAGALGLTLRTVSA
ncbi:MAG: hypothetical protein ACRDKX_00760, partial [Solirubrobacterales bacterium]